MSEQVYKAIPSDLSKIKEYSFYVRLTTLSTHKFTTGEMKLNVTGCDENISDIKIDLDSD